MANFGETARARPGHPGPFIRAQVLERLALSVTEAAEALGITRAAFSAFLNGRASLSAEMALRIEKAFAVPMDQLMHMQCDYDIARAKSREGEIAVSRFLVVRKPAGQRGDVGQTGQCK